MKSVVKCGYFFFAIAVVGLTLQSDLQAKSKKNKSSAEECSVTEVIEDQFGKTPAIREIGFIVDNIYSIDEDKRNIAKRDHQINERLQVIKVMKNSIAYEAGLMPGDKLLQINDTYIPKTADAVSFIASKVVPQLDPKENISFLIIRGRHALQLETKKG